MAAGQWANGQAHVPGFAAPAITLAEQQEEAANPPAPAARGGAGGSGAGRGAAGRGGPGAGAPAIRVGEWNTLDVIVDADMVWPAINGRRGANTATNDRMMGYGPVALHVGRDG